jgi:HupE/UreJ protein
MKIYAFAAALGAGRVPALTLMGLALFSICYFELLGRFRSPRRLHWGVAFLFGLLHGFGFASVLTDAHWRLCSGHFSAPFRKRAKEAYRSST